MKTKVTGYLTQKHGFYYVVLNLPTDEKGKRNRKTLSTGLSTDRNATKAKALLQTMIRAASAGEEVHGVKERVAAAATEDTEESWNTPHPNMLFSNYLEFWLQWKRKSWEEVTYSGYCQNVRSWIAPYFSARKVRLNEITVLDIEMFYTHEINKRGVSGNTVLHYHANIRKALSDAVKLKLIPYNPAAEVERPKKDNFVASYYSADELMEVLPIFANTKMELPVMLAAFYGLRRSEVIGLQWSAIDFERKIVTISRTFERINVDGKMVDVSKCRTKNKASFRSLPLIPAVEQALLKAQKRQHQQMKLCGGSYCKEYKDYICVDDMGHLVTPDYVTRVFREMLLKNGFRPIRYHDLRHPYVKHTTKIFSLRLMDFQAQAYPDARRKTRGACQLLRVGQSRSPVRPLYNRKRFSCLPPQSKMSWILYAISMRLSGYTSTRSISISASSVVSASASKIALDASFRLSCRACSSCFCFACANTAA